MTAIAIEPDTEQEQAVRDEILAELGRLYYWQRVHAWQARTAQHDANDRHIQRLTALLEEVSA